MRPSKVFRIPRFLRGSRGFSLLELMVGLATSGALLLIAMPKAQGTFDRARVKSARTEAFNRLAAARVAAQQGGRVVVFKVSSNYIWTEAQPRLIALAGSNLDTLGTMANLSTLYSVSVYSTLDSVVFNPGGLGTGSGTIRISRGSANDSIAISGFGGVIR